MMAHFADFTGKLSHGMYKSPVNHFALAWSADHTGGLRHQVYVAGRFLLEPGEAFVVDVSDGGADYFTVPISNIWGTTLELVDRTGSLNKAQSRPNADGTYTYVIGPDDPGVHNWIDSDGLREGILTLRMAEFPEGGARPDLVGHRPGRRASTSSTGAARRAAGLRRRARRAAGRAARGVPAPAAGGDALMCRAGSSPAARPASAARSRAARSRPATRWWSPPAGSPTSRTSPTTFPDTALARRAGRDRPRARSAARWRRPTTAFGGHRRAGQQRRLRLPVRGRGGRGRRGPQALRHQLLRRRGHHQGGAARDARAGQRPRHQHLLDDRAGRQPAQRLLLVDQVRARGAHRGAEQGGRPARHQGHRGRAGRASAPTGPSGRCTRARPRSRRTPRTSARARS